MSQGNGRAQRGLVAKFSAKWHALTPDSGKGVHKGNCLRAGPMDPQDAANSLWNAGSERTSLDFLAFYETPAEEALLREALASLGLRKDLPPSANGPILRVGRGAHHDGVILVEKMPGGELVYTGFMIPQ